MSPLVALSHDLFAAGRFARRLGCVLGSFLLFFDPSALGAFLVSGLLLRFVVFGNAVLIFCHV